MDRGGEYMGENFTTRPIILSPPPVDAPNSGPSSGVNIGSNIGSNIGCNSGGNFSNSTPELPQSFKSQRNQSVGYNLQQEFEALKADLDLDLSLSNLADDNRRSHIHSNVDAQANDLSSDTRQSSSSSSEGTHSINSGSRVFSGSVGPSLLAPAANSNTGFHAQNSSSNGGLSSLLMSNTPGFSSLGSVPSRPQSVNDFSPVLSRPGVSFNRVRPQVGTHFYSEMVHTSNWIENLSPHDLTAMLDYWCAHLPFDVLQAMKTRLNNHVPLGLSSNLRTPQVFGNNDFSQYGNTDFVTDMDALSFADSSDSTLQQPKPKANGAFKSHLFADNKVQRPKSADPTLHNRTQGAQGSQGSQGHGLFGERKRSPTSHLYEKTNFLQLAAASNVPHAYSQSQPHLPHASDDNFDHSAANKLGALATINSRVALDFNRKLFQPQGQTRPSGLGHVGPGNAVACEESLNRQGNSSSVPVNSQRYSTVAASKIAAPLTPVSSAGSSMPPEIVDQDLLDNIPAWLKLLRLHKYTDSLKDMHWQSLVELSDEDLESKGVKALGARRKLLKAFETVKLSKA